MNAISRSVVKKLRGPAAAAAAAGGSTLNACMPGGPDTLILAATLSDIALEARGSPACPPPLGLPLPGHLARVPFCFVQA